MDLYDHARRFPSTLVGGLPVVTYQSLREAGLSEDAIRWRVTSGRISRPAHGIYRTGERRPDLLDRIRAALYVAPSCAVVSHQTAALLQGFGVVPGGQEKIHLTVPAGMSFPQRPEIATHQATLPLEPTDVLGVPCTPEARTCMDLARGLRRLDALPVLDAAVRHGATTVDDLLLELPEHDGLRGVRQARDLVPLADPRPECRQESQLRLHLHDGRVVGFVPQLRVLDDNGWEAFRIDLGHEETKVGLEYDGMSHFDRHRVRSDRHRHNWLASRGWTMRYFTDRDLYRHPDELVRTVLLAHSAARRSRPNPHA